MNRAASARHLAALACALLLTLDAAVSEARSTACVPAPPDGHPVIGLALGGGGARGFAHAGVLKYLEEHRIPYHRIAGTSMGSIVGGFAAAGLGPDDITSLVLDTDWADMFTDATDREDLPIRRKQDDLIGLYGPKFGVGVGDAILPSGVIKGQKILFLFETVISEQTQANHFDDLPIPYRAVATDLASGELVIMEEGSVSTAMRASMSVPGAFDPVPLGERLLVDGGLLRNLPVDVVQDMGAEVVIAVDVGASLRTAEEITNVLTVMEQMTSLAIAANTQTQVDRLTDADVLIRPDLGEDIHSASFDAYSEAFTLGYAAARAAADRLAPLAVSEAEFAHWRRSVENCRTGHPVIHFVRLDNDSRFSDAVIEGLIDVPVDERLDVAQLDRDLREIYGLGFIEQASYTIVEEGERTGLLIHVEQDQRGTDFIETGLTIAGSGRGSFINLQAGYLKTDVDDRGSEFRAVAQLGDDLGALLEFWKYLDDGQDWIVNPRALASRRDLLVFESDGTATRDVTVQQFGASLQVARTIGRNAFAALGLRRYTGDVSSKVGTPFTEIPFEAGEWVATLSWDSLDDLYLPTEGSAARLDYIRSDEQLGADVDFDQLLVTLLGTRSWGRHNLLGTLRYDTTLSGTAPVYGLFSGGGFLNMSGFEPNELVGQNFGVAGLGYRYRVVDSGFLPGYVGGSVEYGNVADDRSGIFRDGILNGSLYFGYETPLGPLYLGWGWNEERRGVFFLRLGAILGTDTIGLR